MVYNYEAKSTSGHFFHNLNETSFCRKANKKTRVNDTQNLDKNIAFEAHNDRTIRIKIL